MSTLLLIVIAMLGFPVASSLFMLIGFESFRPDLLTIFVVYALRSRKALPALFIGLLMAMMAVPFYRAPVMLLLLQSTALHFSIRFISRYLNLVHPLFMGSLLFVSQLVVQFMVWSLWSLSMRADNIAGGDFAAHSFYIAIATALFGIPIVALLSRMDKVLYRPAEDLFLLR